MRVCELAAVGTPQLCDAKADIARHLRPGYEIVLYRSIAELRARARELLADEPARRSLAAAARERALREHTWRHRLEEPLTVALRCVTASGGPAAGLRSRDTSGTYGRTPASSRGERS